MYMDIKHAEYCRASEHEIERLKVDFYTMSKVPFASCFIPASLIEAGIKTFPCNNHGNIELSADQLLSVAETIKAEREKLRDEGPKSFNGWYCSGLSLQDYLLPGDKVDERMVNYFRDILPPLIDWSALLQSSEPHSYEKDEKGTYRPTYTTFAASDGEWHYAGLCFARERIDRVTYKSSLERRIEALRAEIAARDAAGLE